MSETEANDPSQKPSSADVCKRDAFEGDEKKHYDRKKKIKELLEQDGETSPWADPFMGF